MRKRFVGAGLSVLASVLVLGLGAAWGIPSASGTGSCKFTTGSGVFGQQINQTGVASVKKVTVNFKVEAHNDCSITLTSPSGDVVTGIASLVGTGTYTRAAGFADACSNFIGSDVVKVKVTVKWVASSPIAKTKATFGTGSYSPPAPSSGLSYSGATAWAGSFLSTSASGRVVLATSLPDFTACTPSTKVSTFDITGAFIEV